MDAGDLPIPGYRHYNVLQRSSPPHFHASYGDYAVTISIREEFVTGTFPKRALRLVLGMVLTTQGRIAKELGVGSTKKAAGANRAFGVAHGEGHCRKVR